MPYSIGTPQATDATPSAVNIAAPAGVVVSAGDTIVVIGTVAQVDLTASLACSDGTNTYSRKFASYDATTTGNWVIFVAENVAAGTFTPTLSWDGSSRTNRGIYAVPVSGVKAASYQIGAIATQASPGTGTDGVTTGNMSPTEQPACVIGAVLNGGGVSTPAAGTGFTNIGTAWQFGTGTDLFRAEHLRITSTGAVALTGTAASNVRHFSIAVILSETGAGGGAATLSSPAATSITNTTATIGATTDQASGTFYVVVDTAANLSGVTAAQIKAGQKASGSAALASGNAAVSTTTPSVVVGGLAGSTVYAAAMVQNNANGDSNVVTTTFGTSVDPSKVDVRQQRIRRRMAGGTGMLTDVREWW